MAQFQLITARTVAERAAAWRRMLELFRRRPEALVERLERERWQRATR